MKITLTAEILEQPGAGYTAWIKEIKGVIAHGSSLDEVKEELFDMLKIKLELLRREYSTNCPVNTFTEEFNLRTYA